MKKTLFCLIVAIGLLSSPVTVAQVVKKPLIEVFTASTCPPCVAGNLAIDGVLANFPGEYTLVKYQMNWPGSGDPYYVEASAVRKDYYAVTGVPHMRTNGFIPHTPNWYPQSFVIADYEILAGQTDISITAEASIDESMVVSSHVEIKAHAGYSSGLRAYIIVVEQNTFNNVGTNGETEFHNVTQGFLSGSEGIELGSLTADQVLTFDLSMDLTGSFTETGNDLSLVVFVQDHATTDVKQSEMVEISHPFVDYNATFNIYDDDYNTVDGGKITVEMGGLKFIQDSKVTVTKLFPGSYYYEVIVPGLLPYSEEFYIDAEDIQQDLFLETPPFLFYEDFEAPVIPSDWTVYNPQEDYFTTNSGRIVFQKSVDSDDPVYFVLPKIAIDQGCVLSYKAGESSGRSNLDVGVITDPADPGASYTEIVSYEIFGYDNMHTFGARIDDPATIGDGYLCFKITSSVGNFFYLDNVLIIENMPGYKVQFLVSDQNSEILPEVEINFIEETLATNDFGYATWRNCEEAEHPYSVSYKGEVIETGTIDVFDDTLKEIVWNTTGIEQISKERIEIYPNPATDQFTIKGVTMGHLSIMDLEGRVLKSQTIKHDTNVQINDLPKGVYLIKIDSDEKTTVTKLVKTK